ncbi:hypothetical protein ACFFK0_18520 [Paenibacillus chartarius]|uniref:Uncharacterized protein n=1 Tax=Paenibacillus chartarius TaxID=747481 RepID=A0ABV6DPB8_9BACL
MNAKKLLEVQAIAAQLGINAEFFTQWKVELLGPCRPEDPGTRNRGPRKEAEQSVDSMYGMPQEHLYVQSCQ